MIYIPPQTSISAEILRVRFEGQKLCAQPMSQGKVSIGGAGSPYLENVDSVRFYEEQFGRKVLITQIVSQIREIRVHTRSWWGLALLAWWRHARVRTPDHTEPSLAGS